MTFKKYLHYLQRMPYISVGGLLFFGLIMYSQIIRDGRIGTITPHTQYILTIISPIAVVVGIALSFILVRTGLAAARKQSGLAAKLEKYRKTLTLKNTLLQIPSMTCLVTAMATKNIVFYGLTAFMVGVLIISGPFRVRAKLMRDLELKEEDLAQAESVETVR
jgi:hypothetical protein